MALFEKHTKNLLVWVFLLVLGAAQATAQRRMNTHEHTTPDEKSGITIGRFHFAASYGRLIGHPDWYFYSPWYHWGAYPLGYPFVNRGSFPGFPGGDSSSDIQSGMGKISLRSNVESAEVYIDGAYAGKARDLATLMLEPGAYGLELVADGYEPFKLRVFVLLGKVLEIDAQLEPLIDRASLQFSPTFCCGDVIIGRDCVALGRPARRTARVRLRGPSSRRLVRTAPTPPRYKCW
jgi:hypothetical protein